MLALSARNEAALTSLARRYAERLGDPDGGVPLADLCATAANRRSHHDFRLAAVASTSAELAEKLASYLDGARSRELETGRRIGSRRRKMAFVFPGHGSQWIGMGRELIKDEPLFASAIEQCAAAISEHVDWSLIAELNAAEECSRIDDVDVIQPAMFAIQVALCELWRSWGVKPDAVIGHSMGEVAAAHVAGALSLSDAARVICTRGRLATRARGRGAMVMAEIPFERAVEFVSGYEGRVGVAACNSPTSTVLSGDSDAVEEIFARLEQSGVFCRRVKIGYASHSPHMDALKGELLSSIADVAPRKAAVPFCSTVAGAMVAGSELGPEYWARNLREPVLFSRAIETLLRDGIDVFLEISPHPILLSAIRECMAGLKREGIAVGSLRRHEEERRSMLSTLASLYVIGKPIDWGGLYPPGGRYVQLPTYPWQRERFWFEEEGAAARTRQIALNTRSPLLGEHIRPAIEPAMDLWQRPFGAATCPMLKDHRCQRQILVPATMFLEMALEAGRETFGDASFSLDNVHFEKPLVLADDEVVMLQVVMTERTGDEFEWQIFAGRPDAPAGRRPAFVRHAHGRLRSGPMESAAETTSVIALQARCTAEIPAEDHYRTLSALALEYGPSFRVVESVWTGDREAIARLKPAPSETRSLQMHPGLLDSALQLLVTGLSTTRTPFVLVSTGQVCVLAPCPRSGGLWAHAAWQHEGIDARGSVRLLTETGELIAQITDVGLRSFELSTVDTGDAAAARVPVERSLIGSVSGEASDDPVAVLASRLREYVAGVLRLAPAKVDLEQSLTTMGIDSLMAIELKSQIERELGIAIPLLQIAKGPSLVELARSLVGPTAAEPAASPGSHRNDSLLSSLLSLKGKES